MNPNYDAIRQGGCFVPWRITDKAPPKGEPPVMLSPGHLEPLEPIEPIADRLVAFWTCELPHSVQPFRAERGKIDGRYAITVWLTAEEGSEVFAQGQCFAKVLYTVPLNGKCTKGLTSENFIFIAARPPYPVADESARCTCRARERGRRRGGRDALTEIYRAPAIREHILVFLGTDFERKRRRVDSYGERQECRHLCVLWSIIVDTNKSSSSSLS